MYIVFFFTKENAKASTCRHAVASDGYDCIHSLVQYYQMVRWKQELSVTYFNFLESMTEPIKKEYWQTCHSICA